MVASWDLYIHGGSSSETVGSTLMDPSADDGSQMSPCCLKGGFIPRTCRSSAGGPGPPVAPPSPYGPSPRPSCRLCRAQAAFPRGSVDASGWREARERRACLLLIEYARPGLHGAVADENENVNVCGAAGGLFSLLTMCNRRKDLPSRTRLGCSLKLPDFVQL